MSDESDSYAVRDRDGKYMPNAERCRSGLHPWPESAVAWGDHTVCRFCSHERSRQYRQRNRSSAPPLPDGDWRDIPGYEGVYKINEHGEVWRVVLSKGTRGGPLTQVKRGPYWKVDLYQDAVRREARVHVLMAEAFIGPRPEGQIVRHLDDNPDNNHISNIVYGTYSDNLRDARSNGVRA